MNPSVAVESQPLIGSYEPSEAGPVEAADLDALQAPPMVDLPRWRQVMRFSVRQTEFVFGARRRHGEVFRFKGIIPGDPVVTSHPDHVRSLFTAPPDLVPSLTQESPLRPIVGPSSVLTAQGSRHMRQRKLLLPPFHGEAIDAYTEMIETATAAEIERWPIGEPIELGSRMQAITLDVIMGGIFGIEGEPEQGSPEHQLREVIKTLTKLSTKPFAQVGELLNVGREDAVGPMKRAIQVLDDATYPVIEARQCELAAGRDDDRRDILTLLIETRTEDGERLSDQELRDELLTLVLAGHETTANSLAWAWERLVRFPAAHTDLTDAVRSGDREQSADAVERVILEAMRSRPVIPIVGRRVQAPWRLGPYGVSSGSPISISILLIHHRPDLYPKPFDFHPERWIGHKPGTYEWLPFGGGTRRCLGAALAMAEQRTVLRQMAERLELTYADPEPERALHRNVTMIPANGARVVITRRLD